MEPFSIGYFSVWGNGGYIDASDTALVFGCGPVGLCALMTCKMANATTIMVDPLESRRQVALQFGLPGLAGQPAGQARAGRQLGLQCGNGVGTADQLIAGDQHVGTALRGVVAGAGSVQAGQHRARGAGIIHAGWWQPRGQVAVTVIAAGQAMQLVGPVAVLDRGGTVAPGQ